MHWRSLICLICITLIPATCLLAFQEHDDTPAEADSAQAAHEEPPNVFAGDWGTVILTLAIFIVLLAVLGKWAWGPILSGLQKREEHIRQSIEEAEKARADGEKALADYKAKLAEAQGESQAIIGKGRTDAVKLADELKQKAQAEAQNLRAQAERDINSAKDQALKQIYNQTVNLAAEMAGKMISRELDPADHRELLQESLGKLQSESNFNGSE